jgi:hypothetical protein
MKGGQNREVASFISSGTDTTRKLLFDKSQSTSRINIEMSDMNMEEGDIPQYQFTLQKEEEGQINQMEQKVEIGSKQSSRGSRSGLSFGTSMKLKKIKIIFL